MEVPVVVSEITPFLEVNYKVEAHDTYTIDNDKMFVVNGISLFDDFVENFPGRAQGFFNSRDQIHDWAVEGLEPPFLIRDTTGKNVVIEEFSCKFWLKTTYYFGYLNKLESARAIRYIEEGLTKLFFKKEALQDYRAHFALYYKFEEIPDVGQRKLDLVSVPEVSFGPVSLSIAEI